MDQLYCPKHWEFTKHVKYSGDFLCTINDLEFVVFVLHGYSLSACKFMPLDLFPRVSAVRGSAAQGADGNYKKRGASPQNRSRVSLPCLGGDPGGSFSSHEVF